MNGYPLPMRLAALSLCVLGACASDPPPPPASPASPSPHAVGDATPPPTVPPKPVVGQEAFYIIEIPAPAAKAEAKVCHSAAECDALLPPNPPSIVRRFSEESWVVVSAPAGHQVRKVVSDGTTATATIDEPCPGQESKLVIYRAAPTVTKVAIDRSAKPICN